MNGYQVVIRGNSYYLSPTYGSGQLTNPRVLVAGPFRTLMDAEHAKTALLSL